MQMPILQKPHFVVIPYSCVRRWPHLVLLIGLWFLVCRCSGVIHIWRISAFAFFDGGSVRGICPEKDTTLRWEPLFKTQSLAVNMTNEKTMTYSTAPLSQSFAARMHLSLNSCRDEIVADTEAFGTHSELCRFVELDNGAQGIHLSAGTCNSS